MPSSTRHRPSEAIRTKVMNEFSYLCAICGKTQPQIHHIDQDASNNALDNLLPLCPNHHLLDAHNPTSPIPTAKLILFRKFRDPAIFLSQFSPLFDRMKFMLEPELLSSELHELQSMTADLLKFVSYLNMGNYYSHRIYPLIGWIQPTSDSQGVLQTLDREQNAGHLYRAKLIAQSDGAVRLLIECLRFQNWKRIAPYQADAYLNQVSI